MAAVAVAAAACSSSPSEPSASVSQAEVTSAYKTLFNFASHNISSMTAVIQDGSALKGSLTQALSSSLASAATGASVGSVTLLSSSACTSASVPSPCAKVAYAILGSGGSAMLSGQTGYATYASGKWLVAKKTICVLLGDFYAVEGNSGTPPGCAS